MFRKTFCPEKRFLAGKSASTMRGVSYLLRFATIRHYSSLFETIRTIRDYSLFGIRYSGFPATRTNADTTHDSPSLFASIHDYSRLFATIRTIRWSGFPDTHLTVGNIKCS